jgi:hypothetical protein
VISLIVVRLVLVTALCRAITYRDGTD